MGSKQMTSVCDGCRKKNNFSFQCMRGCKKFKEHLKKIGKMNGSPCTDYRCGVPNVSSNNREICDSCPIRLAYFRAQDEGSQTFKSAFREKKDPCRVSL